MSWILAIETTTEVCSAALSYKGETRLLRENKEGMQHAKVLTILIEQLLEEAAIKTADLAAIAISKGPGSYTGLRIGTSVAKGLSYALSIPLIAVNTMQSMIMSQRDALELMSKAGVNTLYCPMLDARRMEVYCQIFDESGQAQGEVESKVLNESSFEELFTTSQLVFLGNGSAKFEEICKHPNASFLKNVEASALGMSGLAYSAFREKSFEDVAYFEPFYLKQFQAIKPKNKVKF